MRPIPDSSTDILYSQPHEKESLIELGKALGVSDIKVITTATLRPERVLFHACLNAIQTYMKVPHADERARSAEIADRAEQMFAALRGDFLALVRHAEPALEHKRQESARFCQHLQHVEGGKSWNAARYGLTWNTVDFPPRWQKKAIETYKIVRSRIEAGEYVSPSGKDAGALTAEWSQHNVEYKHYRDLARTLVESFVSHLPQEEKLTLHPAAERHMVMVLGGIGSGKSEMTKAVLARYPEEVRFDRVLHNADYLKTALFRSAMRDGTLPSGHAFTGVETQAESSTALYEGTRKRGFLARQQLRGPDVVLNSIGLGALEVLEGIAGGGKVEIHHLFVEPDIAVHEAKLRQEASGRAPLEADVRWSVAASARSLLQITQPGLLPLGLCVTLHHRREGEAPRVYGEIDAAAHSIRTDDLESLAGLAQQAFAQSTPSDALQKWLEHFRSAGFSFTLAARGPNGGDIACLDSAGQIQILDHARFAEEGRFKDALLRAARQVQIGSGPAYGTAASTGSRSISG